MIASRPRRIGKRLLRLLGGDWGYSVVHALTIRRHLKRRKLFEPELELVTRAVRPGEVAFDIGANHGMWTLPLARAVGDDGRVHAFEPVPQTARTLRWVLRFTHMRNVSVWVLGCGERSEEAQIVVPLQESGATNAGYAHLASREAPGSETSSHGRLTVSCRLVALDDLFPAIPSVSLIKADIEGAELPALRGARRLIERCAPTIVCEIDAALLAGFNSDPQGIFEFLGGLGYTAYRYDAERVELMRLEDWRVVPARNYVFLHPRRLDRLGDLAEAARR